MSINIQHVLSSFQGSLSLNLRILREIYGVRFFELNPRGDVLLACNGRDGKTPAPLRLNCDNAITPYTLLTGGWQPEEFSFVQRVTANLPTFTLIDVGANVGLFSRQCLARLGNCSRVFAYEPDAQNFSLLEFNLAPFQQVECFPVALSDATGEATYYLDPDNSGNYSLNPAAMPEQHATGVLHCVDVKEEVARWLTPVQPVFYKSDTQGFDEKIATHIPFTFWANVCGGIFEVWQIKKPEFPLDKFRIILDQFPNKRFLTAPAVPLTTQQVLEFMVGNKGESEDLGFWR
jgi:FkbM family methyltransferase